MRNLQILKILLFITCSSSVAAEDGIKCFITFNDPIYFSKTADQLFQPKQYFKKYQCQKERLKKVLQSVSNYEGYLNLNYFLEIILNEEKNIYFSNDSINIESFENLIKNKLDLLSNQSIKIVSATIGLENIPFEKFKGFDFSCIDCKNTGLHNVILNMNKEMSKTSQNGWIKIQTLSKIKVFKALRNISSLENELKKDYFAETWGDVPDPNLYYQDFKNIDFYQPTISVKNGDYLKITDVRSMQIIKAQRPVKILIERNGLSLSFKGLAIENARKGELVRIINPKTKKIILGKAIDFNKVLLVL